MLIVLYMCSCVLLMYDCLQQAKDSYETALKVEPKCVEALTQYAQLKQLLGDAAGGTVDFYLSIHLYLYSFDMMLM